MKYLILLCVLPLWTACAPLFVLSDAQDVEPPAVSAPDPGPAAAEPPTLTPLALVQPPPSLVETPRDFQPSRSQPAPLRLPAAPPPPTAASACPCSVGPGAGGPARGQDRARRRGLSPGGGHAFLSVCRRRGL